MVAVHDVIHPGELQGVKLIDFNASRPQTVKMGFFQRAVVGTVAEAIEQGSDFDSFGGFLCQQSEEFFGDAVVAEVEIFEMYAVARLTHCGEEVSELFTAGLEEHKAVVVSEFHAIFFLEITHNVGVAGLRRVAVCPK